MKNTNLQDYLSKWMANFGVVPLLRLAFFLLAPPFFTLLALRIFVTLVLETITKLPLKELIGLRFLPAKAPLVKMFLGCLLLPLPLVAHSATPSPSSPEQTLILARGEQMELHLPQLSKFSVGGKETLSYKFFPKKDLFIIKGKKLGYTDLIIWKKDGSREKFHIYVLSKSHHLRFIHVVNTLKSLNFHIELQGPLIKGKGTVFHLDQLNLLRKILEKYSDHLFLEAKLSKDLSHQIIGRIYYLLLNEYVDHLRCSPVGLAIHCVHDKSTRPSPETMAFLKAQYGVTFTALPNPKARKNFLVKLKLVQLEGGSGEDIRLGLSSLTGSLQEVFSEGIGQIALKNEVLLKKSKVRLSLLAEPETIIREGIVGILELGSQVPFRTQKEDMSSLQFEFAGLKIKLLLSFQGQQIFLRHHTEFTRTSGENIVGNKESSSLSLQLGRPYQIFQIGHRSSGQETQGLPWLSSLPLIGGLFQSKSEQNTYKKIHGILVLEELK